jgi:hypothetical protein
LAFWRLTDSISISSTSSRASTPASRRPPQLQCHALRQPINSSSSTIAATAATPAAAGSTAAAAAAATAAAVLCPNDHQAVELLKLLHQLLLLRLQLLCRQRTT